MKRRLASGTAKYVVNPIVRGLFRVGLPAPGIAILETIGRKSGQPRRNPVTNGLDDGVFWIVAEHGRRANYVRNIEANPNVRVRIGRRWREGTARLVPDWTIDIHERTLAAVRAADFPLIDEVMDEHLAQLEQIWERETGRGLVRPLPDFLQPVADRSRALRAG